MNIAFIQQLFGTLKDGVLIVDASSPNYPIMWSNRSFETLSGYYAQDLVGKSIKDLLDNGNNKEAKEELKNSIKHFTPCVIKLVANFAKGKTQWIEVETAPAIDPDQGVPHLYIYVRDINNHISEHYELFNKQSELESLYHKLRNLVIRDSLTGLFNHRYFYEQVTTEWNMASRYNLPISMLYINIDLCHNYQQNYGFSDSQNMLKQLSQLLKTNFRRASDLVARAENNTFMILCSGVGEKEANESAETFINDVRSLNIEHKESPHKIITASLGLATTENCRNLPSNSLEQLAAIALKKAQDNGGNKFIVSDAKWIDLKQHEPLDLKEDPKETLI